MIALQSNAEADSRTTTRRARTSDGWGPFRRRSMIRVLVTAGFIVSTVWGIQFAGVAGDVARTYKDSGQHERLIELLDPLLIAKACPVGLATVLATIVGFFALLRLKAAARIERRILRA